MKARRVSRPTTDAPSGARWARFRSDDGREGFGILEDTHLAEYEGDMFGSRQPTGRRLARDALTLRSPCAPSKIVALWNNFNALRIKLGKSTPAHPLFFIKPGTSVIGPDQAIERPADYAGKIAYEGELGIVIGKHCKNVAADAAADHIFGFTCVNDVTAVELLEENPEFAQWTRSKGFDTFACLGPVITAGLDWPGARVVTRLDGVERQNYPLSDMIMPPEELVSRISRDLSLLPGDVIACGTSLGVGSIKDGSTVEVQIEGIGSLVNVLKPAAR
jgi:2-keto-4-pentenoate hydratase/2-oxohepta-3-ene-1,7-dioic acid hydratase in catechol pathway